MIIHCNHMYEYVYTYLHNYKMERMCFSYSFWPMVEGVMIPAHVEPLCILAVIAKAY